MSGFGCGSGGDDLSISGTYWHDQHSLRHARRFNHRAKSFPAPAEQAQAADTEAEQRNSRWLGDSNGGEC
jgi:hypothetical protein